ncbi:MAG: hypothetical protein AAF399_10000 [Bacteroidota bacterium]
MFTDFAMGIFSVVLAFSLLRYGREEATHRIFFQSWFWGIFSIALAVFVGGLLEGFKANWEASTILNLRIVLALLSGIATSFQVFGTLHLSLKDTPLRSLLFGVWGASIAIFVVFLFLFSSPGLKTPFTILNTVAIIALFLWYFFKGQKQMSRSILIGMGCQSMAMVIFLTNLSFGSVLSFGVMFNIFMMVGLYFYYRGITHGELWPQESHKATRVPVSRI